MARTRKKKKTIKFELSVWGVLGVATVCFCIFLWMFLLGVWAGQAILQSGEGGSRTAPEHISRVAYRLPDATAVDQHGA